MWNDIEILQKFARFIPYIFIVIGFVFALWGQYLPTFIEARIDVLKVEQERVLKNTAPELEALIIRQDGKFFVIIRALNEIPFLATWFIGTEGNVIISGVMLQEQELHPETKASKTWKFNTNLSEDKIQSGLLELRFKWRSIYSNELNNPDQLKGDITRKYIFNGQTLEPRE